MVTVVHKLSKASVVKRFGNVDSQVYDLSPYRWDYWNQAFHISLAAGIEMMPATDILRIVSHEDEEARSWATVKIVADDIILSATHKSNANEAVE